MASDSDLRRIRKCPDPIIRKALVKALKQGLRYRMLMNGIMLYGENGISVTVHFTPSDGRAARNVVARLRSVGVDLPTKKGK